MELNGVMLAGSMCMRPFVRASVTKSTITYREQTAGPRSANFCILIQVTRYDRQPNFVKIFNVLDLHFKGQRFESSTLGSPYVIISQKIGQALLSLSLSLYIYIYIYIYVSLSLSIYIYIYLYTYIYIYIVT